MSTVDPEPTDHGDGEPSFAWGDNIPSDSEDDEYIPSSNEDSSTDDSDGDAIEIDELEELGREGADIGKDEYTPRFETRPTGTADAPTLLTLPAGKYLLPFPKSKSNC
jgi:hypothetical protein